jgi:hypothetical protein
VLEVLRVVVVGVKAETVRLTTLIMALSRLEVAAAAVAAVGILRVPLVVRVVLGLMVTQVLMATQAQVLWAPPASSNCSDPAGLNSTLIRS